MPQRESRYVVALIYLAGVAQGLALVSFPAASATFTSPSGFALSSTQYGALFVPQVVLAILSSALAPRLARRTGLQGVLLFGLAADLSSMALLTASALLMRTPPGFPMLCAATGALGLGFGMTVMALNTLVEAVFPQSADTAVLTLNALLGLGTALAPALASMFAALGTWWALPLLIVILLLPILLGVFRTTLQASYAGAGNGERLPAGFWQYAVVVLLYGVLETLCGNWASLYLSTERGVSARAAPLALAAFWAAVTIGRVIIAFLGRLIPPRAIYVALPLLLAAALQLVAHSRGLAARLDSFAAAGLACSAILPFSISFAGTLFPRQAATMSGALIAFYQIGCGAAAFGVGPLREMAGFPYSTLYSAASILALALAALALTLIRHQPGRS